LLALSAARHGTDPGDLEMGERAAVRTNKMLDKIGGMYVGKNIGYSRKYAENYARIFGERARPSVLDAARLEAYEVTFTDGPLGLEILWSTPPSVSSVFDGSAAGEAGVEAGQAILAINGRETITAALPEAEVEDLMGRRPLTLRLSRERAEQASRDSRAAATVRHKGVAKVGGALAPGTAAALREFVLAERDRSLAEAVRDPSILADRFSNVQTPRGEGSDAAVTRWDLRLPLNTVVGKALRELLSGGEDSLGAAFAALAGGRRAELWELGAVVSEPGAAAQPVHFDAPARCLFTAFVALQDITPDTGPTSFLPGTHSEAVHRRFEQDPDAFLEDAGAASALLHAGDAALYDSRVLHWGGANCSDKTRALLYVTFRDPSADVSALGVEQHSIRKELSGRIRLGDFRT